MKDSYNIGLIRVVTFPQGDLLNLHGKIIERYYPMLKVTSRCIPDQPYGIHDEETELLAVPKIIELAKGWKDIDALVISCAGDPAVKELRQILDIPVIGAGESTALLALRYGQVFGVLGITKEIPNAYTRILGNNIVGTCDVPGIVSTIDLMAKTGKEKVINKALELKSMGAEVISLACTGMATIGVAKDIEDACGIPVIDPVIAEGLITYYECIKK
ncbi:aspartate/glutamate racemase family protein [Lutispora saccharofermentans]|uniref:Aspartate/glutamate racemase family protein n=1 Tax=Lutispora saccharofermentans TaxID=3024236 RepID=A0ABT1NCR2_9FIRM|nr:aspartate/glutamate racemase family protein [Lutispora saccharofermentans]MCQ1529010.1 aspartate/glutamate racemase family protein [Lutispora saccharofermentans]